MKKIITVFFLISISVALTYGQRRNGLIGHRSESAGLFTFATGPTYCFDDPYGSEFDKNLLQGHNFQVAMGFQKILDNDNFSYRIQLHYANFTGEDRLDKMHSKGYESYVSNTFQLSARAEYGLSFGKKYARSKPNTIYAFAGLGGLLSTATFPNATYIGKTTTSPGFFVPVGLGYKYQISSQIAIGLEVGEQIVFTDLVDGYEGSHVPGVPIINDNIENISLTFYYRLF